MNKDLSFSQSTMKTTSTSSGLECRTGLETPGQTTYEARIITPLDSLFVAAAEQMPRGGTSGHGGSGFGERLSALGSSISHMVTDFTHSMSAHTHETMDMISHAAHDLTDKVTHADYQGMIEETRCSICRKPERNLAVATGVGMVLGLLMAMSMRRRH